MVPSTVEVHRLLVWDLGEPKLGAQLQSSDNVCELRRWVTSCASLQSTRLPPPLCSPKFLQIDLWTALARTIQRREF